MASQRVRGGSTVSEPHSLSLKVLRLSAPTLATQIPLPKTSFGDGLDILPEASLAYPTADKTSSFPLTPLLTLPGSFGSAYVGESFACTLCANNELDGSLKTTINSIRITANLQTPTNQVGTALQILTADGEGLPEDNELAARETLQLIVRHELKESGPHVLAVTVTYTETFYNDQGAAKDGRVRTFRKLYQFVAAQLIVVRSKITEMKRRSKDSARRWIIEAQLENVGDSSVALEHVKVKPFDGIVDCHGDVEEQQANISLKPQDIEQVMFVVREENQNTSTGKRRLAQISVRWRSAMGEPGHLSTGFLLSKE